MRKFVPLLGALVLGCGVNPGTTPDQVDVTGKLAVKGKAIDGVQVRFQPMSATGNPAEFPVTNGAFKGKMTPGQYTYYVTEGKSAAAFKTVPDAFKMGSADRKVDVAAGAALDLKAD